MTEKIVNELRTIESFDRVIISSVCLTKSENTVEVGLITDKAYTENDVLSAKKIIRKYVPEYFSCSVKVTKLTPDEDMIAKKIFAIINENNRQLAALITPDDVKVEKTERGFFFTITVIHTSSYLSDVAGGIAEQLKRCFCGEFEGRCIESASKIDDIVIEEKHTNVDYEIPVRSFEIADYKPLEGTSAPTSAVYIADLNFVAEKVVVCGEILSVRERTITNSSGKERIMFSFTINDMTATMRFAYFSRQKSLDKIRELKAGDSVVLTCKTELYNGEIRPTVQTVDFGRVPNGFVPEKRQSKPVPKYYETVFPEPFIDFTQNDFFTDTSLPTCLTENSFVVFDLETTGLNSSPSGGNMDRIIEIGAFKITNGEIKESFSTFVNPERKLSQEIIKLTGIEQEMVADAPTYQQVMPDFFKFIDGCYLVGHNAANFDFKFIDYYCSICGYVPERKIFDTIPLSQQLLRLSNYKLNTVADYFGISFNHHRAIDDALTTAKIFIELIKLKKSLPNLC
ncbi:MAG: exonuclease domain-containing protein [Candidatus Coproplasma sp.]